MSANSMNLAEQSSDTPNDVNTLRPGVLKLLYTSHFLSTWNSRAFEFGSFLFLAVIYPQTLLPASVYALCRAAAAVILSSWIGDYIDGGERLSVIRLSILMQRAAVILSCVLLFALLNVDSLRTDTLAAYGCLALLSLLACVEKVGAVMNTISVERDWVVVINQGREDDLRLMNSQMRRIDLFCKLVGPLFISLVDSASTKIAILTTGTMTMASVLVEYLAIARVYRTVPTLQRPRDAQATRRKHPTSMSARIGAAFEDIQTYFCHSAFLPSFSLALLFLTVLSFNGQMITVLLSIGLPSNLIGILRGVAAVSELSATWIAPKVMERIGFVRAGIWFLNWQLICVVAACVFFWLDADTMLPIIGSVTAVILSRIGLWAFDLSVQLLVQEEVEPRLRGTFSSQEMAFQNVFEMLSFASTIVFAKPEQFKLPATISAVAVGAACCLYAAFVRIRRGHLLHVSRCMERKKTESGVENRWQSVPQEEEADDGIELRQS